MKYIKNYKVWILSFLLIYTVGGFVFIPWFLTNKVPLMIKENIGVNIEIGKAKFNPYTFNLSVKDVLLKDLDKQPVFGFEKISVNYTLLGLFKKTILFEYLNIASPKLYTKILTNGKFNLENIVPPKDLIAPKAKEEEEPTTIPAIVLQKLTVTNGRVEFTDLRNKQPFSIYLGPYTMNAHDISTKKGDLNAHTFKTKIENDGELYWEGGMKLVPLSLYGTININNLKLSKIYDYFLPDLGAKLQKATLELKLPYQINLEKDLQVNINKAKLTLSNIKFLNKKSDKKIINIPKITLNEFNLEYPKQEVTIKSFNIDKPYIFISLDKQYKLNLIKAFIGKSIQKNQEEKTSSKPWNFLLNDAKINQANIIFEDKSLAQAATSKLKKTSLHVKNISSRKKSAIDYTLSSILNKNSNIKANGKIIQKPLSISSNLSIKNLHVRDYVNYIKPFVNFDIKKADVDLKAKIQANLSKKMNIKVQADTVIKDLHINANNNEKLLSFKSLNINGIKYAHNPMSIDIKNLKLNKPYIRAHIAKDGTTNFSNLTKKSKVEKKSTKKEQNPIKIKIGPMDLTHGTSDFSDFSLPFPFQTNIHDLNGHFSTLDFQSTTPSKLKLTGKIDKYGYTDIQGTLSPFNIKENAILNLLFKNIDLNNMTPYSGKFLGRKIKSGKLSMDLKYNIEKAKLVGDNKINIDTLILGDDVDSPEAVNLPIELAIALLKDSDGQIDIDLPVSGDMNSPEFSYGGVVWTAIGNMITGIVTAPFKFLGSMLGIDAEDLKGIDFDKGSFLITSTEHEKLETLEKILSKRPNIKMNITGKYDDVYDVLSIQEKKFEAIINEELKKLNPSQDAKKVDTYGIALKNIYIKQFSSKKYDEVKKSSMLDNKGKKIKLDIVAFNKKIQNILTTSKKTQKEELINLAYQRALSIKNVLIKEYKIEAKRINILTPENIEAKRNRWIESGLDISI